MKKTKIVLIISVLIFGYSCKAPMETSSTKSNLSEPTFTVEMKTADGSTVILPLSDKYSIEKLSAVSQVTDIKGKVETLKEAEFIPLPLGGKKLAYTMDLLVNVDIECTSDATSSFVGKTGVRCKKPETPETPEIPETPTTNVQPPVELNKYAKICEKMKQMNQEIAGNWTDNAVTNELCGCGYDVIEYDGWDIEGFTGYCSTSWGSAGGEGHDNFDGWLTGLLKKACEEMKTGPSYNAADTYCECYGVAPLNYLDYRESKTPEKEFVKDCGGQ